MAWHKGGRYIFCCGLLSIVVAGPLAGQCRADGHLSGTVTGPGDTPLPGATVLLTSVESQQTRMTWTDGEGRYVFDAVTPGHYRLEVKLVGFQTASRDDLQIEEGRSGLVDLELAIAPLTRPSPAALLRGLATLPPAEAEKQLKEVLAQLPPQMREAARDYVDRLRQAGAAARRSAAREQLFPVGSELAEALAALPDATLARLGMVTPPVDSGVDTEASSADSFVIEGAITPGIMFGGGSTRRGRGFDVARLGSRERRFGVNQLRGSLSINYASSALDAKPYALNGTAPPKPPYYRSQTGISLSGPLIIPGLYNSQGRTNFFLNYRFGANRNETETYTTVPTLREREGDFSQTVYPAGPLKGLPIQIFDPATSQAGPRVPFAGNVIPPERIDPIARGLLAYIPLPNLDGPVFNYRLRTTRPQRSSSFSARITHRFPGKGYLSASYSLNGSRQRSVGRFPALQTHGGSLNQSFSLSYTHAFSSRFTYNFRFNFNRTRSFRQNAFAFEDDIAGRLGILGSSRDPMNWGLPGIQFTNFGDINDPAPSLRRPLTTRLSNVASYVRGSHTWRGGFELRYVQRNDRSEPDARGTFVFTGLMTSNLTATGLPIRETGFDFADFLLGLPQQTSIQHGLSSTYLRSWEVSMFGMDDWRVTPQFALNFGVRYELLLPPVEKFNHMANLDVAPDFSAVAVVLPSEVGPYTGRFPRALVRTDANNIAPRIGIAWRPFRNRGVVVRSGYGIFFNAGSYNQFARSMTNQPPFAHATQTVLTSPTQLLTLHDGFPAAPPHVVTNTYAVNPNYRVGYAQIWNLHIQHELMRSLFLSLGYIGTKGTHLDLTRWPNRAPLGSPLTIEQRRMISNARGFRYQTFGASSAYHAFEIRLRRRFAGGIAISGTYTWGKSLDNASTPQDESNIAAEWGRSSFDIRHRLSVRYSYEFPFGGRRRYRRQGWLAQLFGNWGIAGDMRLESGRPFTARVLGSSANISGTGTNFTGRADVTGQPVSLPRSQRSTLHWFNTEAFTVPPPGRFGNAGRNTITGPGTVSFNMSLSKRFSFGEKIRGNLRVNAQNVFNIPNFTGLATVVNAMNYGWITGVAPMRHISFSFSFHF